MLIELNFGIKSYYRTHWYRKTSKSYYSKTKTSTMYRVRGVGCKRFPMHYCKHTRYVYEDEQ